MTQSSPESGAVLLLGGTGTVCSRLAPLLKSANYTPILASRSGFSNTTSFPAVKFDWTDESTWESALSSSTSPVRAVYIIVSGMMDPGPAAKRFVELAISKGVERFVLQSATSLPEGGPAMGQIHKDLHEMGDQGRISWAVVRPTWFQENFIHQDLRLKPLKEESKIVSATGKGKVPWVSVDDIAAVACHALTAAEPPNGDFLVVGPELLSYDDVAALFSEVLGREVTHENLTAEQLTEQFEANGMEKTYASILAGMDDAIAQGSEEMLNDVVETVTGRAPRRFGDVMEESKSVWE